MSETKAIVRDGLHDAAGRVRALVPLRHAERVVFRALCMTPALR